MLVKYPGLTLVGGLAFAFAIWVAAGAFEFAGQVLFPRLPLPDADRVVALESWDAAAGRAEPRVAARLRRLARRAAVGRRSSGRTGWRSATSSRATASRGRWRSRRSAPRRSASRARARSSAARSPRPTSGPSAPPVAVIGYDVWQARFGGDPNVVGRVVRLGRTPTTVVGVMPEGFAFPVAQSLWVPLRLSPLDYPRGEGPASRSSGGSPPAPRSAKAQAELTTLGRRAAADFPSTHQHLRPRVMPYARVGRPRRRVGADRSPGRATASSSCWSC